MGRAVRKNKRRSGAQRRPSSSKRGGKRSIPKKRAEQNQSAGFARECVAIAMIVVAVFLAAAIASHLAADLPPETGLEWRRRARNTMGPLGAYAAGVSVYWLGWCSYALVLGAVLLARSIWTRSERGAASLILSGMRSAIASAAMVVSCAVLATVIFGYRGGGRLGSLVSLTAVRWVNEPGAVLLSLALFLLSLGAASDFSTARLLAGFRSLAVFLFAVGADIAYLLLRAAQGIWAVACAAAVGLSRGAAAAAAAAVERFNEKRRRARNAQSPAVLNEQTSARRKQSGSDIVARQALTKSDEPFVLGAGGAVVKDGSSPDDFDCGDAAAEVKISRRLQLEQDARRAAKAGKSAKNGSRPAADPPARAKREYQRPSKRLLVSAEGQLSTGPQDEQLLANSRRLEEALKNFRIGGRVVEVHPGPVITLYEFTPAAGVKVQRIINLADDLALALKVSSVRVFAPVPGKGTVGIEVPNPQREIVRLRDILESERYQKEQTPLPLALGKDTYGEPYIAGLPRMPHLLIAGATGTGKSVCINSLLLSLLYRHTPDELNLLLIDPKMLELSVYEDIPHLKAPVVTNAKRARGVLWWAVEEMERRYRLLKDVGVRDLSAYNRLAAEGSQINGARPGRKRRKNVTIELQERDVVATGSPNEGLDRAEGDVDPEGELPRLELERLPRIVVVVDELADLMLSVGREIEDLLARLAQKARAAGIHLIVATQRPSVNVITGLIKANFPARISFKVAGKVDARTVMDTSGAEKLLGQGDMLFLSPSIGQVKRLHSPYVSDQEVHDVVDWLRSQGEPEYDAAIEEMISKVTESESGSGSFGGDDEYDEFYDRAVTLVIDKGQASTSMVQRAFRIGYNRAARILETMEREGIVGPADGSKPRQVLVGSIDGA